MEVQSHRFSRRTLLVESSLAVTVAALGVQQHAALAQEASPEAGEGSSDSGMPPLPEGAVVVAEGLWNPGDIAFDDQGNLYIAESGVFPGGDSEEPAMATPLPDGSLPQSPAALVSPQVTIVSADGGQTVLTTAAGGVGIGYREGYVYVSQGGGSVGSGMAPNPAENTVSKVDVGTGETTLLASLGQFEVDNNPDGTDVNPNLYGLAVSADGMVYVADAGGNTIYRIDSASGAFELFAVVPNLTDLTGSTPTPEEEQMQPGPRQPVPTAVMFDPTGNIVVTLLSLSWNGPSIITYAPDGTYTASITGLSTIVNGIYGPDGLIYVTQLATDFESENPGPGAVLRIEADGAIIPVVEGLFFPHGIAFNGDGDLFVATNSIISGPDAAMGQVLKFEGLFAGA